MTSSQFTATRCGGDHHFSVRNASVISRRVGDALKLVHVDLEQALVERDFFRAWLPVRRSHVELMSLESDPRWPVSIETVIAAVAAGARATI